MIGQQSLFNILNNDSDKCVVQISYDDTKPFLLGIHYARRMPSISYAFGMFEGGELIGVCTYGVPASNTLCKGLAGDKNKYNVLELNRLCFLPEYNGNNRASFLISHSLKMLPNRTFVVSYADTAWSHVGYVYQATNWLYTGMSAKRTDTFQPSGLHPRAYKKGMQNAIRQTRSQKHRYVYLVGDKRTKKQMKKELKYKIISEYPKGDETRYNIDEPKAIVPIKVIDKRKDVNK